MDTIIDFKSRQGEMLLDARCSRCTASWPSITVKGARSHASRQHYGTTCRVGEAHRRLTDEEKAARHRESVRKSYAKRKLNGGRREADTPSPSRPQLSYPGLGPANIKAPVLCPSPPMAHSIATLAHGTSMGMPEWVEAKMMAQSKGLKSTVPAIFNWPTSTITQPSLGSVPPTFRAPPLALASLDDGSGGGFKVVVRLSFDCEHTEAGLHISSGTTGHGPSDAARTSLSCVKAHASAFATLLKTDSLAEDVFNPNLRVEVLFTETQPKTGSSMGAAGVLSLLGSLTGIGLESCVAVTGEVDVRGGLHAVDGLEGKLTWASANPAVKVVFVPSANMVEAMTIQSNRGLGNIRLVTASNVFEMVHMLLVSSVLAAPPAASRPGLSLALDSNCSLVVTTALIVGPDQLGGVQTHLVTIECAVLEDDRLETYITGAGGAELTVRYVQGIASLLRSSMTRGVDFEMARPGCRAASFHINFLGGLPVPTAQVGLAVAAGLLSGLARTFTVPSGTLFWGTCEPEGSVGDASGSTQLSHADLLKAADAGFMKLVLPESLADTVQHVAPINMEVAGVRTLYLDVPHVLGQPLLSPSPSVSPAPALSTPVSSIFGGLSSHRRVFGRPTAVFGQGPSLLATPPAHARSQARVPPNPPVGAPAHRAVLPQQNSSHDGQSSSAGQLVGGFFAQLGMSNQKPSSGRGGKQRS